MNEINIVKFKTGMQTTFAKLIYSFNRHIDGVKAKYNVNYCEDRKKAHTLDIMYPVQEAVGGLPCVIYLHGGGWTAYDKSLFRSTTKELAACGAVVFNCNYRLAPKYDFDDMEDDLARAVAFVRQNAKSFGGDPDKIIFAGDSSGAHLAALYINGLCKQNSQLAKSVIGCVYFYGVYDLAAVRGVDFKNKDAYLSATTPRNIAQHSEFSWKYSPINHICSSLPPTLLCSGMVDSLYEGQTAAYLKALQDIGVRVESLIFPIEEKEAQHRFITFSRSPVAQKSFVAFGNFLKSLVKIEN